MITTMQIRVKATGEILNIAKWLRIVTDKCDSYGIAITFAPEDVEFLSNLERIGIN